MSENLHDSADLLSWKYFQMVDPKPLAKPLTENEASVIHAVATLVMS
jgi:hypothetical protein